MITSPYFWLALIIMTLVIFGSGYDLGSKHTRNNAAAEQLIAVAEAREEAIEQAKIDQKTAQNYEADREIVRIIYVRAKEKAHENIENHPEYGNCSLDDDGLQLYNSHPGRTTPSSASPDSRVSGSTGSIEWQTLNDPNEQPGARADVLRLPGAPQSAIGMVGSGIGGTGSKETLIPAAGLSKHLARQQQSRVFMQALPH